MKKTPTVEDLVRTICRLIAQVRLWAVDEEQLSEAVAESVLALLDPQGESKDALEHIKRLALMILAEEEQKLKEML